MKKVVALVFIMVLSFCCLGGCGRIPKKSSIITLSMDNYEYYLTIDSDCISSSSIVAAGKTWYFSTYKVTISGALEGLYVDCSLYYRTSESGQIQKLKLNAVGFGTLTYERTNGVEKFIVARVEGEIHF